MKPKRLDLQGIRGLAILSVLAFHFFPNRFPNGYLGVDQYLITLSIPYQLYLFRFFVLSGFLMCMLLKRAYSQAPFQLILLFYSKRFKRILPLYLLIIFLSITALYHFYPDSSIEPNKKYALKALLFVSNIPSESENDYFEMIAQSIDIFSHTWSLSVEVQYYFLVPFMFLIINYFSQKMQFCLYTSTGLFSFIFYSKSGEQTSFNSVFARIWQFSIGMIVYLITNHEENQLITDKEVTEKLLDNDKEEVKVDIDPITITIKKSNIFMEVFKYLLLISLISITTCPWLIPALISRPLTTVLTGLLMLFSKDDQLLSNRILTYIGDISYSLYLIHWPICAYSRMETAVDNYDLISGLLASILLAIFVFETFEKWYLNLSYLSIGILSVILFLISVIVIHNDMWINEIDINGLNNSNMTFDEAEALNRQWNKNDIRNLITPTCQYENSRKPFGWCRHTGLSPNGTYKILIFGNSWTANHASLFYQECGHNANSILQGSEGGCEALYPTTTNKECPGRFNEFLRRIEQEQPDIGFLITRAVDIRVPQSAEELAANKDPRYEVMINQLKKLIRHIKKKLYILNAIPNIEIGKERLIVKMLRNGTDPEQIDKTLVDEFGYQIARQRYARLRKDCGAKCELIDYLPIFYNQKTKTFRYFDKKGVEFLTSGIHFSAVGLEHLRPTWRRICRRL